MSGRRLGASNPQMDNLITVSWVCPCQDEFIDVLGCSFESSSFIQYSAANVITWFFIIDFLWFSGSHRVRLMNYWCCWVWSKLTQCSVDGVVLGERGQTFTCVVCPPCASSRWQRWSGECSASPSLHPNAFARISNPLNHRPVRM